MPSGMIQCEKALPTRKPNATVATMSETPHTPDFGGPWSPAFRNSARTVNGYDHGFMDSFQKRAIECVNACVEMADPSAEIAAMREAIKEAHEALKLTHDCLNLWFNASGFNCLTSDAQALVGAKSAITKLQTFIKP